MRPFRKSAPYLLACAALALNPSAFAAETDAGRTREAARYAAVAAALTERGAAFAERPLLAEYGAFGTSLCAGAEAADTEDGVILAVPLLSGAEKAAADIPALSFAQEAALALLARQEAGGGGAALAVFFLADEWVGPAASEEASFAAWQDMLDAAPRSVIVYLDMSAAPDAVFLYTGGGAARLPLAYLKEAAAVLRGLGLPFFARAWNSRAAALFGGLRDLLFEAETPLVYLGGSAPKARAAAPDAPLAFQAPVRVEDIAAFVSAAAPALSDLRQSASAWEADTNYRAVSVGGRTFFAPERAVAAGVFVLSALALAAFLRAFWKTRRRAALARAVFAALLACGLILPAGTAAFLAEALKRAWPPRRAAPKAAAPLEGALFAELESAAFLERDTVTLTITGAKEPLRFELLFETDEAAPYMYESPLPARPQKGGIAFASGNYPPNPLVLELALPATQKGAFRVEAYFTDGSRAAIVKELPARGR